MKLHYHPLSSYSQKTLTALYEKNVSFEPVIVDLFEPNARAAYKKSLSPLGRVPVLVRDDGRVIPESSIIIEYVDGAFSDGPRLIPEDKESARITRFHDRNIDWYLLEPLAKVLFDPRKPEGERDPAGVREAKATLDTVLALYERHFEKHTWANEREFSMADCAAAPALFYLKMLHPYDQHKHLTAYAGRLFERPSFQKVIAQAQPFLAKFMR